jgi:uncharacterized protein YsxB (DUF464 family)
MAQRTPEELDEMIDALDVMQGMLRDPHKIINGTAEPLTDKDPSVCYAISSSLCHVLDQRAKALGIPDTFQKAIDVWEFEVNNAVGFMLENFHLEMIIMSLNTLENQYKLEIRTIQQPNVVKLLELINSFY